MDDDLSQALALALERCAKAAPNEAVSGLVLLEGRGWLHVPFRNVSSTPSRAFAVDPLEWMRFETQALDRPTWVLHSHVDAPATLSQWDRETFTVDGAPLLPHLGLAVTSVRAGRVVETAWFTFREGEWQACSAV